jgi:hypothetical protein
MLAALLLATLGLGACLGLAGKIETTAAIADSEADGERSITCSLAPAPPPVTPAHDVDAQSLVNASTQGTRHLPAALLLPVFPPRRFSASSATLQAGADSGPQGRRSHLVLHVLLI